MMANITRIEYRSRADDCPRSIKPSLRHGHEDPHGNGRDHQGTAHGLQKDRVLHLPERRFLNPDLPIKDLSDHVPLVVSSDPRLVLIAVATVGAVERLFQFHVPRGLVVVGKQLPRSEMTVMHAMENLIPISDILSSRGVDQSLTTHIPFHAAISVATPIKNPMADKTRQPRPALLNVMSTAAIIPPTIPPTPRPRAKMTRARLPLQMLHRMKFGWA